MYFFFSKLSELTATFKRLSQFCFHNKLKDHGLMLVSRERKKSTVQRGFLGIGIERAEQKCPPIYRNC